MNIIILNIRLTEICYQPLWKKVKWITIILTLKPIETILKFINFFTSNAAKTKESIKYSHKHFSNFLQNRSNDSLFLSSSDKYEIINIISSLDSNKSTEPSSIPAKILKLLKNEIFSQLSDILNVSFSTGAFTSILKIKSFLFIKNHKYVKKVRHTLEFLFHIYWWTWKTNNY